MNTIVSYFITRPERLFLLDLSGALLSAFLLGIVLVQFEAVFGIPRNTLYFLAFWPCLFAAYDFYCYGWLPFRQGYFLKIIALANVMYCLLSLGCAFYHVDSLTYLGWSYIVLEIAIVLTIARIEFRTAMALISRNGSKGIE